MIFYGLLTHVLTLVYRKLKWWRRLEVCRRTARVCPVGGTVSLAYQLMNFIQVASPVLTDDTLESLQSYARSLLATLPDAKGKSRDDVSARNGNSKASEVWKIERDGDLADEGGLTGCREAVELLTRNQRKGEG